MPNYAASPIDFDRCRARARTLRHRARAAFYWRLAGYLRSAVAVAIILATFWMLPSRHEDCATCAPRAVLSQIQSTLH